MGFMREVEDQQRRDRQRQGDLDRRRAANHAEAERQMASLLAGVKEAVPSLARVPQLPVLERTTTFRNSETYKLLGTAWILGDFLIWPDGGIYSGFDHRQREQVRPPRQKGYVRREWDALGKAGVAPGGSFALLNPSYRELTLGHPQVVIAPSPDVQLRWSEHGDHQPLLRDLLVRRIAAVVERYSSPR